MASRRLKSDRFFTTDFTPQVYTRAGLEWIDRATMVSVLLRHHPELAPVLGRVTNAFTRGRCLHELRRAGTEEQRARGDVGRRLARAHPRQKLGVLADEIGDLVSEPVDPVVAAARARAEERRDPVVRLAGLLGAERGLQHHPSRGGRRFEPRARGRQRLG